MDTKFLVPARELSSILDEVAPSYRCLEVNGKKGAEYRTLYYDTPDYYCYFDHHNGRTFRNKVRKREYIGSNLSFLEVKRKTGSGRTDKVRTRIDEIHTALNDKEQAFIRNSVLRGTEYIDVLWNGFKRYTLVHRSIPERLTIDVGLWFKKHDRELHLEEVVICELKQERINMHTEFYRAMRNRGIRPAGMSKYCLGMLLMDEELKRNSFKPTILKIERIQNAA
jgi:hypothetical protein